MFKNSLKICPKSIIYSKPKNWEISTKKSKNRLEWPQKTVGGTFGYLDAILRPFTLWEVFIHIFTHLDHWVGCPGGMPGQ